MQGIKGLIDGIGGLAVRMNGWLVTGWELGAHKAYEIYAKKGIVGRFFQGKMLEGIDVVKRGQALVERAGLRKKGKSDTDVSHEKGLPCMERWGCRGSP